jgi:hypothetical protein
MWKRLAKWFDNQNQLDELSEAYEILQMEKCSLEFVTES